jgi:hypothetical protein
MRAAVAQRTKVVGNHGHTSTAQSELVLGLQQRDQD